MWPHTESRPELTVIHSGLIPPPNMPETVSRSRILDLINIKHPDLYLGLWMLLLHGLLCQNHLVPGTIHSGLIPPSSMPETVSSLWILDLISIKHPDLYVGLLNTAATWSVMPKSLVPGTKHHHAWLSCCYWRENILGLLPGYIIPESQADNHSAVGHP